MNITVLKENFDGQHAKCAAIAPIVDFKGSYQVAPRHYSKNP